METVLMLLLMGVAVYFLMIRPQQKRSKEAKEAMSALAEGSRIMTVSGILGTIKHLGEKQAVIEVSPGVEMTIDKRAISPQPVEDEFEYADDADSEGAADTEVSAEPGDSELYANPSITEPVITEPVVTEPAGAEPVVEADQAWDNPSASKN